MSQPAQAPTLGGYPYPSTGPANMKSLDGIQDFTPEPIEVRFRVGQDVFYGVRAIPAIAMMRYAAHAGAVLDAADSSLDDEQLKTLTDLIRLLLVPESAELLLHRMDDRDNPVDIATYMKVVPWLMEQYGMRPTQPSSGSPDGSPNPDDGTSSTVSSVDVALTSGPYPQPVP